MMPVPKLGWCEGVGGRWEGENLNMFLWFFFVCLILYDAKRKNLPPSDKGAPKTRQLPGDEGLDNK